MFSLQRWLSKSDRFFDLLEGGAEEARESVQALLELFQTPPEQRSIDKLRHRRRGGKRITEEMSALLCESFITPLEREDLGSLSYALSRIPKIVKKFAERYLLVQTQLPSEGFTQQVQLAFRTTDTLAEMVRQLRHGADLEKIRELSDRMHNDEGTADDLILELLRELYSGRHSALEMIVLRDLYELLEKVIDRCRDACNVIVQIALKNS